MFSFTVIVAALLHRSSVNESRESFPEMFYRDFWVSFYNVIFARNFNNRNNVIDNNIIYVNVYGYTINNASLIKFKNTLVLIQLNRICKVKWRLIAIYRSFAGTLS